MQFVPLSDALGIELLDFDLTRPSGPEEQADLRRLFGEHHLLLVRGQSLTDEDHDRFVQVFGPLSLMGGGSHPYAGYVSNRDGRLYGPGTEVLLWHSDGTYGARPGIATSLWAQDVSPSSAPTMFANAARALENLPPEVRHRIESLNSVHLRDTHNERTSKRSRVEDIPSDAAPGRFHAYEHPIVFQAPHLDRKVLLVNELLTSHIPGLPRDEGESLIQQLFAHLYADDNVYCHQWQNQDVILWDNIILQHGRPKPVGSQPRHLRRLSLDGWNTGEGVLDWIATGGGRDKEYAARSGT